jgi:single-strand DNA-binding protein
MASVNRVALLGNVGRDPVATNDTFGDFVTFPLATKFTWKDKDTGEKRETVDWHKIKVRGYLTSTIMKFVSKGDPIYLEGRLKSYKNDLGVVDTWVQMEVLEMLGKLK